MTDSYFFCRKTVRILAISRRKARNCILLSIVSEAERKRSRNSSSRASASFAVSCSTDNSWSPLIIRVRFTSHLLPAHDPGLERQLRGGEGERLERELLGDAVHLEEDPGRLHHDHPPLRVAFALPHPGLGRLLGDRLFRKDPDPDLSPPLPLSGHRDPPPPPRFISRVIATRDASICRLVIQPGSRHIRPYSPNAIVLPRVAMPRLLPLNVFRNLIRLGASIAQVPVL